MPELRKDPIIGRWVIISSERALRPHDFSNKETYSSSQQQLCPFCQEDNKNILRTIDFKERNGAKPITFLKPLRPFLNSQDKLWKKGQQMYDLVNAVGFHEIIVETKQHIANMADLPQLNIENVFLAYRERMNELEKEAHIKYALVFKNYGRQAGGGDFEHSRSQIIGLPVNVKRVKEELQGAKFYFDYRERCIFCDMLTQELQDKKRVVMENEFFVALIPFASRFPFETWIIPRIHRPDFYRLEDKELPYLASMVKEVLLKLKNLLNDPPYNYVIHTAPFRRAIKGYWTTIEEDYHWHIEIIPRVTKVAGFEWGTGFYICPSLPEKVAAIMRGEEIS